MGASYPDINGVRTSWASILLGVGGRTIPGVKSLNYKDVGEIPKIKGTTAVTIGRTRGTVDAEGDIEIYQEEWYDALALLTAAGQMGYMEPVWPITVSYAEPIQLYKTHTDRLVGVRFFGAEQSHSEGAEALTVKLQLSIVSILWDGKYRALRY
jgi:hypothetical protein